MALFVYSFVYKNRFPWEVSRLCALFMLECILHRQAYCAFFGLRLGGRKTWYAIWIRGREKIIYQLNHSWIHLTDTQGRLSFSSPRTCQAYVLYFFYSGTKLSPFSLLINSRETKSVPSLLSEEQGLEFQALDPLERISIRGKNSKAIMGCSSWRQAGWK